MNIKGILFDKDGTLLKFREIWLPITQAQIERLTSDLDLRRQLAESVGWHPDGSLSGDGMLASGSNDDIARAYAAVLGENVERIKAVNNQVLVEMLAENQNYILPTCDLRQLFRTLKVRGLVLGLATADDELSTQECLRALGVEDLLDFVGTGEHYAAKPDPELFEAFCQQFGFKPADVAVVGDSVRDLAFAQNAQAACALGVLCGVGSREELSPLATFVIESPANLLSGNHLIWEDL